MENIDDYDLIDLDFAEFIRRGKEAFGIKSDCESTYRLREDETA